MTWFEAENVEECFTKINYFILFSQGKYNTFFVGVFIIFCNQYEQDDYDSVNPSVFSSLVHAILYVTTSPGVLVVIGWGYGI